MSASAILRFSSNCGNGGTANGFSPFFSFGFFRGVFRGGAKSLKILIENTLKLD